MNYEASFEVRMDGKVVLLVRGGDDGINTHLEFEQPSKKKSIRAEWKHQDVAKSEAGQLPKGIPTTLIVDSKKPLELFFRNGLFYEQEAGNPWVLKDEWEAWGGVFAAVSPDSPLLGARDISSWASCLSNFTGAGAGVGAAVGGFSGGVPGFAAGGAIGAGIGGAFGTGYCTTAQFYKPPPPPPPVHRELSWPGQLSIPTPFAPRAFPERVMRAPKD
jgi:hypothetical protein